MKDLGEEKDVREAAKRAKEAEAARATTIRLIASQRNGRDFLWWLLEQGSPFTTSMRYDGQGRGDPMRTAYSEGWRGLGALIMAEVMRADPQAYIRMLTENRNVAELEKEKENGRSSSDD